MLETMQLFLKSIIKRKKLWLIPIIVSLLLIGGLLIIAQNSVFAPLIYAIF